MAWIEVLWMLFLMLSCLCGELVKTQLYAGTFEQTRDLKGRVYDLPEDLDNGPLLFSGTSKGGIGQSPSEVMNVSAVEYLLDYQDDMAFEHGVEPAAIDETYNVAFAKDLSDGLAVLCSDEFMTVTLPAGPVEKVKIQGLKDFMPVLDVPASCRYSINEGLEYNVLTIFFKSCHVTHKDGRYSVKLLYSSYDGRGAAVTLSCADGFSNLSPLLSAAVSDHPADKSKSGLGSNASQCQGSSATSKNEGNLDSSSRPAEKQPCFSPSVGKPGARGRPAGKRPALLSAGGQPDKIRPHSNPTGQKGGSRVERPSSGVPEVVPSGDCSIPQSQQIPCGGDGISASRCMARGCCVDPETSVCFYPMDECTADKNFVFAIHFNDPSFSMDSAIEVVVGKDRCPPVLRTDDFAIFKFPLNGCGTRTYEVGQSVVYMAEVQTIIRAYSLKYGVITRDSPSRILVECHYPKGWDLWTPSLATVGYMVKSPSVPPSVFSVGLFVVQVRIATDHTYTKYYPHDHQPLRLMLGKPVFLEVSLTPRHPDVVLLVNYCLAYPRSARNALVLLYEGCPNRLDGTAAVLHTRHLPQNRYRRRFEIKTFQFMDLKSKKYLNEEIYFMCSTEVCLPSEKACDEGCFSHNFGKS